MPCSGRLFHWTALKFLLTTFSTKSFSHPSRYAFLDNLVAEQIVGSTDKQPLLETPGEVSCELVIYSGVNATHRFGGPHMGQYVYVSIWIGIPVAIHL